MVTIYCHAMGYIWSTVYTWILIFLVMVIDVQTTANNHEMAYIGLIWIHSENFFMFLDFNRDVVYKNACHTLLKQYFDIWIVNTPR